MGKVSVKAILIGGLVDAVSSILLDIPLSLYVTLHVDLSNVPKDRVESTINTANQANIPLYVTGLLVGMACSVLGGYVAARLAKHDELLNGCLSSFLCVVLGIYMIAAGKDAHALWVQILLLLASPVLALLGGCLMKRQRQARAAHNA